MITPSKDPNTTRWGIARRGPTHRTVRRRTRRRLEIVTVGLERIEPRMRGPAAAARRAAKRAAARAGLTLKAYLRQRTAAR